MKNNEFFYHLDKLLEKKWAEIIAKNPLVNLIAREQVSDRYLFALYLIETFHYTSHNAKNQALVVSQINESSPKNIRYMKFCLKHALEETGHELMALHDLGQLGVKLKYNELPEPLYETKKLIKHIYEISTTGSPYQRLGYSYWAESSYKYFGEVLAIAVKNMQLRPSMLTFFNEHSDIDIEHFNEIKKVMDSIGLSEEDKKAIESVLCSTLDHTEQMLTGIYNAYKETSENKGSAFNGLS